MKKTILFLGLAMLLTGCGSSAATTQTDTESTTEVARETTTTVVESEETVSEEENWEEFEIRDGFELKGKLFGSEGTNIMLLMLNFEGDDIERQISDFVSMYLVIKDEYNSLWITITVKNKDGYESGTIDTITDNTTLPNSWQKLIEENTLEEIMALVDKEDLKKDAENMGKAIGMIEVMEKSKDILK